MVGLGLGAPDMQTKAMRLFPPSKRVSEGAELGIEKGKG